MLVYELVVFGFEEDSNFLSRRKKNAIDKEDKNVWVCDLSLQQYKHDKVGRA